MSSKKLKVGVIGVGALGRHHARLYREIKNSELIGVYDTNRNTAQNIATEYKTKAFLTIEELADQCEAFSIAVPSNLHYQIASLLIKKKKHLLIEKPIATNLRQAGDLVSLAEENCVIIEVGHTERYNPVMGFIDGKINDVRFIEARRMAPYPPQREGLYPRGTEVGVVLDLMIHDIELILHLVKSKVEKVEATGLSVLSPYEDLANARITFKNGCIANITASRISQTSTRVMQLYQPERFISLDYGEKRCSVYSRSNSGIVKEEIKVAEQDALCEELKNFVTNSVIAIETGRIPELKVSGKKGLEALRLAIKITNEIHKHNKLYNIPDRTYTPESIF